MGDRRGFPVETQKECVIVLGERLTPEEAAKLGHALVSAACKAVHGSDFGATLRRAALATSPWERKIARQNEELDRRRRERWEGKGGGHG